MTCDQKHTPGPWFQGCEDDPNSGDIYMQDGSLVAEAFINGDLDSRVANARLIAAAPDLLEELRQMTRAYVRLLETGRDLLVMQGCDCDPVDKMEAGDPNLIAARAAIAKATGGAA